MLTNPSTVSLGNKLPAFPDLVCSWHLPLTPTMLINPSTVSLGNKLPAFLDLVCSWHLLLTPTMVTNPSTASPGHKLPAFPDLVCPWHLPLTPTMLTNPSTAFPGHKLPAFPDLGLSKSFSYQSFCLLEHPARICSSFENVPEVSWRHSLLYEKWWVFIMCVIHYSMRNGEFLLCVLFTIVKMWVFIF